MDKAGGGGRTAVDEAGGGGRNRLFSLSLSHSVLQMTAVDEAGGGGRNRLFSLSLSLTLSSKCWLSMSIFFPCSCVSSGSGREMKLSLCFFEREMK